MSDNQRPERATEVAAERRRRDDSSLAHRLKLAIPDHVRDKLAAERRSPYWGNDTGNRISDLTTRDDYDRVDDVEPVKVGTDAEGKPLYSHLLAKRDDFIAEDRAKADKRRREIEAARFRPQTDQADGMPLQGQLGATTYVDPASSLKRRNEIE